MQLEVFDSKFKQSRITRVQETHPGQEIREKFNGTKMHVSNAQLNHLANLYGINTNYMDVNDRSIPASRESLLAVLKSLGAPVFSLDDIPSAIREKHQRYWQQPLEPVTVLWNNDVLRLNVRLPESLAESAISASLLMETGEKKELSWKNDTAPAIDSTQIEGIRYVNRRLCFSDRLPIGYHKLYLNLPHQISETLIVSAPVKAYNPPLAKEKMWGVFLPLYALHTHMSWGGGDFSDLEALIKWTSSSGGHMVGTLPLLPLFFDEKMGSGPYTPASRLFWNEFYLDITRIPELEHCQQAQALINSADFQNELHALRDSPFVDYLHQLSLKRKVLEELSECFFTRESDRLANLRTYIDSHSALEDYARFRAAGEQHGLCWANWPQIMRNGKLKDGDYSEKTKKYYLYTQWLAHEQFEELCRKATRDNVQLYLDLPVGVHPYSYDIWRQQEIFVYGIYGGAPPDSVFTGGQNWGFPPIHPEKVRHQGYRYIIQCLRHQLNQAGILRVDHMMNFHRLFWIPEEMDNRDGVYVRYQSEELYAILATESYRHQSLIIGEDLGMVPPEVRPMMAKHGIYRMYVGQYELVAANPLEKIPSHCVASLNTHDMFPFSSFWQEDDILERIQLKLLDAIGAQKEIEQRREIKRILASTLQNKNSGGTFFQDNSKALKAILNLMAVSPAYALLINLEDLWLETHPQNIPGTNRSQNWSLKARYSLEEFSRLPQVIDILREIDQARKRV